MNEFQRRTQQRQGPWRGLVGVALTAVLLITTLAGGASAHVTSERVATQPIPAVTATRTAEPAVPALKKVTGKVARYESPRFTTVATPKAGHGSAGDCTIGFDNPDALLFQTDNALNQWVVDPWREACKTVWTEFTPSVYGHLHLGYLDPAIGLCLNSEQALSGSYARIIGDDPWTATCQAIDPFTELRSSPRTHTSNEVVRLRMYDYDGYQPFRLDRIRVKDQPIRLCAQPMMVGPYLTTADAEDPAGASCWNLDPGYWDLSGLTSGSGLVTVTGAPGSSGPLSFDDIGITDQS